MKRELKFRAWNHKAKQMYYNVCIDMYGCANDGVSFLTYGKKDRVMQYTGLKEKKGKKIYEGDIIKVTTKHGFHGELLNEFKEEKKLDTINGIGLHFIGVVRIDLLRGLMFENPKTGYAEPMFSRHRKIFSYHSGIEIIGNIYQNPELLK